MLNMHQEFNPVNILSAVKFLAYLGVISPTVIITN